MGTEMQFKKRSESRDYAYVRYLYFAFSGALSLILILAIASYLLFIQNIKQESSSALLVDAAGEQETLSQRAALLSLSLVSATTPELRLRLRGKLSEIAEELEQRHNSIVHGDKNIGFPVEHSEKINQFYFGSQSDLDFRIRAYADSIRALANVSDKDLGYDDPYLRTVITESAALLSELDAVTKQYRAEGVSGIERLRDISLYVLIGLIVVVASVWIVVFRPLLKKLEIELLRRTRIRNRLVDSAVQLGESVNSLQNVNEELEQFAGMVAHDLRGPLHNISSFGGILKQRAQRFHDLETDEFIAYIQQSAARMDRMIRDLLHFSKVTGTAQRCTMFSLKELVEEVLADLSSIIKDAGATVDLGELPTISADRSQISHLIQNLLQNAVKFRSHERPLVIKIEAECSDDKVCRLMVEDNGIGFGTDKISQMFRIFSRLENAKDREGTGLGLAICKKIVLRHGGDIQAENVVTGGARFIIKLPLSGQNERANPNTRDEAA